jgi:outer membrane protein assembly factor BamB
LILVALVMLAAPALAENWPQWRGPRFNGSSAETGLPTTFSPTEGVAWKAELPGSGGSTPIVWGDHVFVTVQDRAKKLWALCLSRGNGSVLWKHAVGTGFGNKQGNTGASASPITNGQRVWFYFGTGELLACGLDGRIRWRRNIQKDHGKFEILWDYASSPLLYKGRLYIPVIHGAMRGRGGKSYLVCVDPATGRDLWKRSRPSDAPHEAKQAYTTPIPYRSGETEAILVSGADYVTAHDPATGRERWRSPSYNPRSDKNYRTVVSPVTVGKALLVAAPRGGDLFACPVGGSRWAWTHRKMSPDVPTPLAYKGRFYVLLGAKKTLLCLEPRTGRILGQCKLGGRGVFQASPTGADDKIYCINLRGETVVVSAEDTPRELHRTDFGGRGDRGTIAVSDRQLFIKIDGALYCIGTRGG